MSNQSITIRRVIGQKSTGSKSNGGIKGKRRPLIKLCNYLLYYYYYSTTSFSFWHKTNNRVRKYI